MRRYLLYIAYIFVGLLIISAFFFLRNFEVSDIVNFVPETPWLAALALLGLFCVKTVIMVLPLVALYISAGIMLPVGWAIVICLIGLFLEMTIGYFIGRRLDVEKVAGITKRYKKLDSFLSGEGIISLPVGFFLRMTPLPFDIVSMVKGAFGMKYPIYVLITYAGTILSLVPYVYLGRYITTPLTPEFIIPLIVVILLMLCPFIASKIRAEYLSGNNEPDDEMCTPQTD